MSKIYKVPAGHVLTVSVESGTVHVRQLEDQAIGALVVTTQTFGPYLVERSFILTGSVNFLVEIAPVTSDSRELMLSGEAEPVDAVRASLVVNPDGDDNALAFTAVAYGAQGNAISIAYLDPDANDAALSVAVDGKAITVYLATDEAGEVTSTAAEVLAEIEASEQADALVTGVIHTADTGSADDGSGVVTAMAQANFTGGIDGSGQGVALPGCLYIDTDNGFVYRNSGSRAAPAWTKLEDAAP